MMEYFIKDDSNKLIPVNFNANYFYYCMVENGSLFYKGRLTTLYQSALVLVYDKNGNDICDEHNAGKTISEVYEIK